MSMHSVSCQSLLRSSLDLGKSVLILDYLKVTLIASGCINEVAKNEVNIRHMEFSKFEMLLTILNVQL